MTTLSLIREFNPNWFSPHNKRFFGLDFCFIEYRFNVIVEIKFSNQNKLTAFFLYTLFYVCFVNLI